MGAFTGKTLLVTGGTGSFGHATVDRFLQTDIGEIRIFSRDEKKQDDMRKRYSNDKLKFYIGDVRDRSSLRDAIVGVDYIFHAAALKQVPSCEFFPLEAVKTNVLGTDNVLTEAINAGVARVVCLSTDKAAYPINAMGISKAMMEKIAIAKSRNIDSKKTTICVTRYGNVMASRGSVIPLFYDQMKAGMDITVTDGNMTRFMMTLEEAVDLVLYAFEHGNQGDLFIKKSSAATINTLAESMIELFGNDNAKVHVIGSRHGEKLFETIMTEEEAARAEDMGDFFRIPADSRDLNYNKYFVEGNPQKAEFHAFTSHNAPRMDCNEMIDKLKETRFIQAVLRGEEYEH